MIQELKTARAVSTPVILVTTTDQSAAIAAITDAFQKSPVISWDCLRGFTPLNPAGQAAIAEFVPTEALPGLTPGLNPAEALTMALQAPAKTIVCMRNAHKFWSDPPILQGITLTRDVFRTNQRTLIMLAPAAMLPPETVQDVIVTDDPLPTVDGLTGILNEQIKLVSDSIPDFPKPTDEDRTAIVAGLRGLTAYAAESVIALSIAETRKIDPPVVWRRKRDIIGQTRGLTWENETRTLDDLGGLQSIKAFARQLFAGSKPPRVIVRIDEIEKQFAGIAGDNTGVSQDLLGAKLRGMEDNGWSGLIAVGPPGSGKTAFARTLGTTYGRPTLELDLGAVKASLVGESEQNIRAALKVIQAIGGSDVLWIATCNKLDVLPPELRRRYKYGVWFFDLPSESERRSIWSINLQSFGLAPDAKRPDDQNWTGAEIRNACELASHLKTEPVNVAQYIVPVHTADPASIKRLREAADGRFLCANEPGPYRIKTSPASAPARAYAAAIES